MIKKIKIKRKKMSDIDSHSTKATKATEPKLTKERLYNKIEPDVLKINYNDFFFSFNGEYVIEGLNPSNHCFYYYQSSYNADDDDDNDIIIWKKKHLPKNKVGRCCHTTIFHDNYVYLIGGYNGTNSLNSVERYDFLTKTWNDVTSMRERRTSCDSVLYVDNVNKESCIFILGGIQNGKPLQSVDMYNIRLNKWEKHGELLIGRSGCKCFLIKDRNDIVIIGGASCNSFTNKSMKIEVYNIRKRQSRFIEEEYSFSSFGGCMKCVNNKHYIYLSGGGRNESINENFKNPTNQCFLFIVEDYKMIELPQMISNRMYHSMTITNDGFIHVFGGFDGYKIISKGEWFDGTEWKTIDYLSHPYCASTVLKVDGRTEIIGNFKQEADETNTLVEGPVQIKSMVDLNQVFETNGQMSTNGYRHGMFSCRLGEKNMHPIIYHENDIISSYDNFLMEKKIEKILANKMEIPTKFCCPISKSIYIDPVVLSSGNSYERKSIVQWFDTSCTDPLTRESVESQVYPNKYLQQEIKDYIESIECDSSDG